ncbi:formimidoylglutamase [Oceanobacillus sp. FSL W8-0428]|uniref:Formimidoylglutamase n=1 Tax=Oceanobacillus sojae TaxID=582851 RepID=A0A511ZJS4_9BACI|nr:formimidoylglutamase [Oceanobacillus sojae]GEN87703.1 formimidoylglutamase [Oceanobacillus sojae]
MYQAPANEYWKGREDSSSDRNSFRFHQTVNLETIQTLDDAEKMIALVGFECEEGVRRNKGRLGAKEAPNKIRTFLSNMPSSVLGSYSLIDTGNIICEGRHMEKAQMELGVHVEKLLSKKAAPIIIGGGHETFFGHYLGARSYLKKEARLGIINIDAHFDMRRDMQPSSGTMFRQILESDKNANYLCIGIQPFSNTKALFQTADELGCSYFLENEVKGDIQRIFQAIDQFSADHDALIFTLCTDSISASEAPGVSAPAPFGLAVSDVRKLLNYIASKDNTISFDISEVNPAVDENDRTARLGAALITEVIHTFSK